MAAALSVFVERGYDGARIRHIAERAEVSEAALYAHQRSKEALALALFRMHIGRYARALATIAEDRQRSVEERVRGVAERTLEAFSAEPEAVAFVITHQARFIAALPDDFPYPIRVVEGLLSEGQAEGSVRPGPIRLLAALVFGCITQPIRTVLEAPPGTIELDSPAARGLTAEAAWRAVSSSA